MFPLLREWVKFKRPADEFRPATTIGADDAMTSPDSGEAPPFQRPIQTDKLRRDAQTKFRIAAEPPEYPALARFLGVDAVERLTFAGFVSPEGKDSWRVRGRMVAKVVQTCVISLEPVRGRIDEEIERTYVPERQIRHQSEVILLPDEDDAPDYYTDVIDLAQLALESLALSIDPYPRREGAELDNGTAIVQNTDDGPDETTRPFAGLADLLRRSGAGGE
jgi:uncharacterized metal-binding protein YceD (DUF177 family)